MRPNVNSLNEIRIIFTINRVSNHRDIQNNGLALFAPETGYRQMQFRHSDIHPKTSPHNGDTPWLDVACKDSELKDKPILLPNLCIFPTLSPQYGGCIVSRWLGWFVHKKRSFPYGYWSLVQSLFYNTECLRENYTSDGSLLTYRVVSTFIRAWVLRRSAINVVLSSRHLASSGV